MLSHRSIGLAAAILLFDLLKPSPVTAQDTGLASVLVRLIQNDIVLAGPPPGSVFPSHSAHFEPGADQKLAPYLFNQAIVSQLSGYPLGSSSGGFSYSFDASLGTYTRSTTSFGPSFAERAVTLGRRRWNVGANYQHASFYSFEGQSLDNGSIKFYLTHADCCNQAFFEGDVIQTALSMDLTTDTFVTFANYGITTRLDVGVAVPIQRVELNANVNATILRLATGSNAATSQIHTFPGGGSTALFSDGGTASGIGDVVIRSKYHFFRMNGGGLAAALDLRTPTGDVDNLLGTGATTAKVLLIGSGTGGAFAPHFNLGYTFAGES